MVVIASGCAGNAPTTPDIVPITDGAAKAVQTNNRSNWGYFEISIDTNTLEARVIPLRSAEFNANVTQFMQPPVSPTSRITVSIDAGASDFPNGLFAVDVTLLHPFPGLDQYSGFDVRGILMANESVISDQYPNLSWSGIDEARLLNADGWTRWWNWSEFTTYGSIFGYTEGALATPGFAPTATLNPYKYFADTLEAEDELVIDPETRGFFSVLKGSNTRRYMIQFTMNGPSPLIVFAYAVDAGWDQPDSSGAPHYEIDDFSLLANCQEPYLVRVEDAGSTAYWENSSTYGGDLIFDITVYDWQAVENPNGLPGEITAIWLESPSLIAAPIDILPTATASPNGPTSSVYHVELTDITPSAVTGQTLLIGVESADPLDYAPNLPGVTGFEYPEEPLAAYLLWEATILDEAPILIPIPQGVESCGAAGVVEIHWGPVNWPTLTGYNIFRKESTEPSFDLGTPLNSVLVTNEYYYDTDVLDDGTTYDYVVTSVDFDLTESPPSDMTSATPLYTSPSGFIDLDGPGDGTMGSDTVLNVVNAAIAPDGTAYIVWDFNYDWPDFHVKFVRGDVEAGTFGTTVTVGDGDKPDVAFDSEGTAHIVWGSGSGDSSYPKEYWYANVDTDDVVSDLMLLHTINYGNNWSVEPTVAVTPDDEVHIAFAGYEDGWGVFYVHGTPGDFSTPEKISSNYTSFIADVNPNLVPGADGRLHLTWTGTSLELIMYMVRDTDGVWGPEIEVANAADPNVYRNYRGDLAVDNHGVAHVTWNEEDNLNDNHPWYANNRSGSFDNPIQLESEDITNGPVSVACDRDGNAYVIWYTDMDPEDGHDWQTWVALIDRDDNVVITTQVSEGSTHEAVIPSMASITYPCYSGEVDVMGVWKAIGSLPPQVARIRTDQ